MSSGFISEAEIAEQRRMRQEEWERVRTADQPLEAPEEAYDPRSLYERLQEQKNKRDAEYEEAHKLKNMIKGLDDDEVEFLDLVDRTKLEEERKKNLEEEKEMRDFKAAVASLQEKSLDEKLKQELKNPQTTNKNISSGRNSQLKLLAGVVVKRSEKQKQGEAPRGVKRKHSPVDESRTDRKKEEEQPVQETDQEPKCPNDEVKKDVETNEVELKNEETKEEEMKEDETKDSEPKDDETEDNEMKDDETKDDETTKSDETLECKRVSEPCGLKCIGILPGLGSYDDSSDSGSSSDMEHEREKPEVKYDLLGRKIDDRDYVKEQQEEKN